MKHKNRYSKRARITERKFRDILKLFALNLTAKQLSKATNINRNTINRYLKKIRERIAIICEQEARFRGIIEADESYFGQKRKLTKEGEELIR